MSRRKLSAVLFIAVSFAILFIVLEETGIGFTPAWLLPLFGGLFIGYAMGYFKTLKQRPTVQQFFSARNLPRTVQFVFGVFVLITGWLLV